MEKHTCGSILQRWWWDANEDGTGIGWWPSRPQQISGHTPKERTTRCNQTRAFAETIAGLVTRKEFARHAGHLKPEKPNLLGTLNPHSWYQSQTSPAEVWGHGAVILPGTGSDGPDVSCGHHGFEVWRFWWRKLVPLLSTTLILLISTDSYFLEGPE